MRVARKIQRCASELFDAIEKPLDIELAQSIWLGLKSVSERDLQLALHELHRSAELELKRPHTGKVAWCVQKLADIYERHFNRAAGVSRPIAGGKISGPFSRFVLSVTKPLGISMSAESIAKALAKRCQL